MPIIKLIWDRSWNQLYVGIDFNYFPIYFVWAEKKWYDRYEYNVYNPWLLENRANQLQENKIIST